ncbi:Intramembrane protease RasP/YluC implicated incell division based on FtsL cleavage [Salmonella enterica subsp. arizonae]|uniref:Intramembrane protease RasP/YluC implicated incell division based on FtsL cleavage n=1 Tax=Salmonella enterica subsp. arizonae TaxID=59203 RepID=A0A447R934_SALER|nr:Intramembrane protease RasP/YluC implicated incell division based on FtsL cleavage [Salmonella enterica subsp. arizonae]
MLSILWNLAAFIIALGVLITVHEFGHFWVARRCGVRVERFSIGLAKRSGAVLTGMVPSMSSP